VCATLTVVDLVVMSGYTLFAAKFLALLRAPRQIRFVNRLVGGLFVGAAALLATFKRGAWRPERGWRFGLFWSKLAGWIRSTSASDQAPGSSTALLPARNRHRPPRASGRRGRLTAREAAEARTARREWDRNFGDPLPDVLDAFEGR
jgi:hypothetical protein